MADHSLIDGGLTHLTTPTTNTRMYAVSDPAGTPAEGYVELSQLGSGGGLVTVDDPALWGTDLGYDQEFDRNNVATLPTGWAWVNQGSATYLERFGGGCVTVPVRSGTYDWKLLVGSVPAGNWAATMKLSGISHRGGSAYPGVMVLRDSSSGKFLTLAPYPDTTPVVYVDLWTSATAYGSSIGSHDVMSNQGRDAVQYMRITKNSSTSYTFEVSTDGIAWIVVRSAYDPTATLAPDQIGFGAIADTIDGAVACHWVRLR